MATRMTFEEHMFLLLGEGGAKIGQRVSKLLRPGPDEAHEETGASNRELVAQELDDLLAVAELLRAQGSLREPCRARMSGKHFKIGQYLAHSQTLGRIDTSPPEDPPRERNEASRGRSST